MNEPCRLKNPLPSIGSNYVRSKLRSDSKNSRRLEWRYILTGINYIFRRYKCGFGRTIFSN